MDDVINEWTDAEKEVWGAWSKVEQDLSQPQATHVCTDVLDAVEATAHQWARLQGLALRSVVAGVRANPLVPPQAESFVGPVAGLAEYEQHLISWWFGLARQIAVSVHTTS
jgi:hypothetical protein